MRRNITSSAVLEVARWLNTAAKEEKCPLQSTTLNELRQQIAGVIGSLSSPDPTIDHLSPLKTMGNSARYFLGEFCNEVIKNHEQNPDEEFKISSENPDPDKITIVCLKHFFLDPLDKRIKS